MYWTPVSPLQRGRDALVTAAMGRERRGGEVKERAREKRGRERGRGEKNVKDAGMKVQGIAKLTIIYSRNIGDYSR